MEGKVCIVAGASSGMGEAIAVLMASRGASVTLGGRDETRLKAAVDKCVQASGGHPERFIVVAGDLNVQKVREDLVQRTIEKFKRLDVLVANAGTALVQDSIFDMTEESYDVVMNTNVKSVFFLIKAAVNDLEKSKGNIVITSSVLSELTMVPQVVYPMSKAALDHMTHCLALNLGPRGIRVNSINPSYIPSRLVRGVEGLDEAAEALTAMEVEKQPLGSRLVQLNEIAEAALFLASDSASFITGQHLKVDGGRGLCGYFLAPGVESPYEQNKK